MPISTLPSKGQLPLPQTVRTRLNVHAGDVVDFVIETDGTITVRAGRSDVTALRGLLHKAGRPSASLDAMDDAIRHARRGPL
jgi:antitoxin PrlF